MGDSTRVFKPARDRSHSFAAAPEPNPAGFGYTVAQRRVRPGWSPMPIRRNIMEKHSRRTFVKTAGAGLFGGVAMAAGAPALLAAGANDRVVIGAMGMSRGLGVAQELAKLNVRIAYVCDPDQSRLDRAQKATGAEHAVADVRRVLDDKAVDAVVIATPDHWHAPAAILACAAGKHVYVEKPCSHNIREGRLMIEAARRHDRVMQVGTQSRSTPTVRNGDSAAPRRRDRQGAGGQGVEQPAPGEHRPPEAQRSAVRVRLRSLGRTGADAPLPDELPARHLALVVRLRHRRHRQRRRSRHRHRLLGPRRRHASVSGLGPRLEAVFDDDQQFPDTQYVVYEYPPTDAASPKRLLIYEQRIWSPYLQEGAENGNAFYGTEGYMILAKATGWKLYGPRDKLIREEAGGLSMPDHAADFLAAIRDHRRPNADIEIGHRSAVLSHLANILARTGRPGLTFDPDKQQFIDAPDADALIGRTYRENHWAAPKGG